MEINKIDNTTSFKAIKNIKCTGLYKKYPEYSKNLIDSFSNNSKAMDFCKKYDVDIILNAFKDKYDYIKSNITILVDNPYKNKIRKFFDSLFRNKEKIQLSGSSISRYDRDGNIVNGLENSTKHIIKYFTLKDSSFLSEVLNDKFNKLENDITDLRLKKVKKLALKQIKYNEKYKNKQDFEKKYESLNNSISDLINKTK